MYEIAEYDKRYRPTNKSGGELKNADYVKLPVKPKGDGLQTLLKYRRGLEVFGIWCLLLEKTTDQEPETRGKILNHKDEPASISEIAQSISLNGKENLVEYALSLLVLMGWVESTEVAEISSEEFRKRAPKISKDKISKDKIKEVEETSAKQKFLDFVYLTDEEHKKLLERYGENNTRKLIDNLNRYIGQTGKKYKSHYYTLLNFAKRDNLPDIQKKQTNEQSDLEKQKQKIRDEDGQFYREQTTEQLNKLLKSNESIHIVRRWLIKEILNERIM